MSKVGNNRALNFLSLKEPDDQGRYAFEYLNFNHDEMEQCHGWIQWAFPIDTKSNYNPLAPIIDSRFLHTESSNIISIKLLQQFMKFIGLDSYIEFNKERFLEVIDGPLNHNILRISRVLKHLVLTNKQNAAKWLLESISKFMIRQYPERFCSNTVAYWYTLVYDVDKSNGFF